MGTDNGVQMDLRRNDGGIHKSPTGDTAPPGAAEILEQRKEMIRFSWSLLDKEFNAGAAESFYQTLFYRYPEVEAMFNGADMGMQAKKLYDMLRVAVRFLDNMEHLLPSLRDMGVRHARVYQVQRAHYSAVTTIFIETINNFLEARLQSVVSPESMSVIRVDIAASWGWLLTLVGNTMADAADSDRCNATGATPTR